jgi:hypothetical protein
MYSAIKNQYTGFGGGISTKKEKFINYYFCGLSWDGWS